MTMTSHRPMKMLLTMTLLALLSGLSSSPLSAQERLYIYKDEQGTLRVSPTPIQGAQLAHTVEGHRAFKPTPYPKAEAFMPWIEQCAKAHQLPVALVLAVIEVESHFNPKARSRAGAMGLMQLMPSIARALEIKNPYDPQANIEGGCALLATLKVRYKGDLNKILAAYNAGGVHVRRKGGIPFKATRGYVQKVMLAWSRHAMRLGHKAPSAYAPKETP